MADAVLCRCAPLAIPPAFPRLLVVGRGIATGPAYRHDVGRRVPGYVTLQVSLSGCGTVWEDAGHGQAPIERPVPPGSCLVFRAGEAGVVYGLHPAARAPWRFAYAEIGGDAAQAMAVDVISRLGRVLPLHPARQPLVALLRLIDDATTDPIDLPVATACGLACGLLALLAEGGSADAAAGGLVADAVAWLAARLDQPVGVADAAAALGVSREHLTRRFTRAVGQAPGAWLTDARLARGERLLRGSDASVRDITRACGLGDAGHFAAAFRRRYGIAPQAYRRRLAGRRAAGG